MSTWAEKQRVRALKNLKLLGYPREERFDRFTRMARRFFDVSLAMFSLIDDQQQHIKSRQGGDLAAMPRELSFCNHALQQEGILVVEDATKDPRFRQNPLVVGEPHIRFYAGLAVREPGGFKIGTFCIMDPEPRYINAEDLDVLRTVVGLIEEEILRGLADSRQLRSVAEIDLARAIHRAQNVFLAPKSLPAAYELMLNDLIQLTSSTYGFIGETLQEEDDRTVLKIDAITNLSGSSETERLYQQVKRRGIILESMNNLIGAGLDSEHAFIANKCASDPRHGGLPFWHPKLDSFMAIPLFAGERKIGLVGLANRPNGFCAKLADELAPFLKTVSQLIERQQLFEERAEHARRLEKAANYDALTGLPNRNRMAELLQQELYESNQRQGKVSVCFIDLDGFNEINDSQGHKIGDQVLKAVADNLSSSLREYDIVSRLGGDEFVAILRDVETTDVYERLMKAARTPIRVGRKQFRISASMGVTVYPDDDSCSERLLRHADQAMYRAKESGKNQYCVFERQALNDLKERTRVLNQIPQALRERQLKLYLQPKIALASLTVDGFEALIRWHHPTEGVLSPINFLPLLEDTELAIDVGNFVLAEATSFLQKWQSEGKTYNLSINLSPFHFMSSTFISDLESSLQAIAEDIRHRLILELLETTALDDTHRVLNTLAQCRSLGVQVSLDDFGTGYSSLDYFRRLPVNEIKIDRTFVIDMLTDEEDHMIVGAVIDLARNFKRRIVAEGIEDKATEQRLLSLGCEVGQGYLYTPPLPFDEAMAWVTEFGNVSVSTEDKSTPGTPNYIILENTPNGSALNT